MNQCKVESHDDWEWDVAEGEDTVPVNNGSHSLIRPKFRDPNGESGFVLFVESHFDSFPFQSRRDSGETEEEENKGYDGSGSSSRNLIHARQREPNREETLHREERHNPEGNPIGGIRDPKQVRV